MLIGALADAVRLPSRTVRLCERRGLLPEPRQAPIGCRVYDETTAARLHSIRTARTAGLTLAGIANVLRIRDSRTAPCTHAEALLAGKVEEGRERNRRC